MFLNYVCSHLVICRLKEKENRLVKKIYDLESLSIWHNELNYKNICRSAFDIIYCVLSD